MLTSFWNRIGLMTRAQADTITEQAAEQAAKAVQERMPDWWGAYAAAHEYNVPDPGVYENQASLMAKVSYLFTVITLTAQSAASQDFDIFQGETELEDHVLEALLKSPNPMQTGFEFLRDHFIYKLLNASSFWWLNSTSPTATPTEIWLIPPGNIKPIPDEKLGIKGYYYYPGDGQELPIPAWQIVWFRGFHPSNQYASLSGLEPLAQSMQTDINTQKFLSTVYGQNSGRLPGIIAFKSPINDVDWRNIKKDIRQASNDGSYMMLRGVGDGVSWLQAAATISEMETLNGRKMTKEDIYDTFAPGLMNMTSVNSTEANAITGKKTFAEFTLFPLLTDTEQKVNKELSPRFGGVSFEFDDPRDLEQQAEAAKMDLETKRAGVFTSYAAKLPVELAAELADLQLPARLTFSDLAAPVLPPETTTTPPTETAPLQDNQAAAEADAIAAELMKWQKYAVKHYGKSTRQFEPREIPPLLALRINAALQDVTSAEAIPGVFARVADEQIGAIVLAQAINGL